MERFWAYRHCLVTGGAGFGGGHLCEQLLERGAKVFVLDRWLHRNSYLHLSGKDSEVQFIQGDVRDRESLGLCLDRLEIDTVFHLAAQPIIPVSNAFPCETLSVNVVGTYAVLEAIRVSKRPIELVFASSGAYYGRTTKPDPISEDEAPLPADNIYAPSKVAADIAVRCYVQTFGLRAATCRFMNTYGPGDTNFSRLIPRAIQNLVANPDSAYSFGDRDDGRTQLDFLYVGDMSNAYIKTAENLDRVTGEAVNFGTGNLTSTEDVASRISLLFDGVPRKPIFSGPSHARPASKCLDAHKAQRILGWKTTISLDEGLERTIDWYKHFWQDL